MSYLELSVREIIESDNWYIFCDLKFILWKVTIWIILKLFCQMSHLELSVREIVESAVIQTLKDKVKLLIRRHPGAEPILSGNLKQIYIL